MFDPVAEPTRGTIGDPGWLVLPGLEAMMRAVRGKMAPPPMHHLMGLRPTDAGLGRATFTLPITQWQEDAFGIIEAGTYCVVADAALSIALYTGLPPGRTVSTTVLTMLYIRPATRDTTHINARAQSAHIGREVGVSECRVEDQFGRLLAYGNTRVVVRDLPVDPSLEAFPVPPLVSDPPDPYLRPVPADAYMPAEAFASLEPIDMQRGIISGEFPRGPRFEMHGMVPLTIEPGIATARAVASPWYSAGTPFMYGGLLASLCDGILGAAMWSTLSAGEALAMLDMEVRFLRPVPVDGGELAISGRVVHGGKSVRVAEAAITLADGRTAVMATGSGMVLPGGMVAFYRGKLPDEIVGG